jgi:trans-AT polyketide synthase, acyltransferase and oxidoreductase domains
VTSDSLLLATGGERLDENGHQPFGWTWIGPERDVAFEAADVAERLRDPRGPCYAVRRAGRVGVAIGGELGGRAANSLEVLAVAPPATGEHLGDAEFRRWYGMRLAYAAGAMANGIASEDLVIALGRAGILGSFGAAGLPPARVEAAIRQIQSALPHGPCSFNLIHSPGEEALERRVVELYLASGVTIVEASAFLDLTPHVVRYRAAGLRLGRHGEIERGNRLIAKLSRREVARLFLEPAPGQLLAPLVSAGLITEEQARLAARVPLADDITVEADSAGHTDNRALVVLLPSIVALRDAVQRERHFTRPTRIGAAGGIATPAAALAAFAMGAAYIVTGSVNQACVEAGTSAHTRRLLAAADFADVAMAPAADMFEMGVRVQVLKRGTLFAMRAQRLYELYRAYESVEALPAAERDRIERQIFRAPLETIWEQTRAFFAERAPELVVDADRVPKRKLALIFRWYLGLSSGWSNEGTPGRETDYQIWCGPAMGAFNDWARGSYLESPDRRQVVDVARQIMDGAARLWRLRVLATVGVPVPTAVEPLPASPR